MNFEGERKWMDEILAVIIQDNAFREQAHFQTYPTPSVNLINQIITSPAEADKIAAVAQKEADGIMAIAYSTGIQPPVAMADATVMHTTHSVPPTATPAMMAIIAADCLDHGKPQ